VVVGLRGEDEIPEHDEVAAEHDPGDGTAAGGMFGEHRPRVRTDDGAMLWVNPSAADRCGEVVWVDSPHSCGFDVRALA
jgi:hypothetical protein